MYPLRHAKLRRFSPVPHPAAAGEEVERRTDSTPRFAASRNTAPGDQVGWHRRQGWSLDDDAVQQLLLLLTGPEVLNFRGLRMLHGVLFRHEASSTRIPAMTGVLRALVVLGTQGAPSLSGVSLTPLSSASGRTNEVQQARRRKPEHHLERCRHRSDGRPSHWRLAAALSG